MFKKTEDLTEQELENRINKIDRWRSKLEAKLHAIQMNKYVTEIPYGEYEEATLNESNQYRYCGCGDSCNC